MITITDIKVRHVKQDAGKLKAVATIVIDDCFAIHDIKIVGSDKGDFVAMPSRKAADGEFKDIVHPINTETREYIREKVLEAYNNTPKEE